MPNIIKEITLEKVNVRALSQFLALVGVAMVLPFFIHLQWLTGPIINAILILILFLVGVRSAMVVALVPSLMALAGGLLPAVLAPAVPFIMISNALYVLSIDRIYDWSKSSSSGYLKGVLIGSILKFAFLYVSVSWIVRLLIKQDLAVAVAKMMSWPQLVTALLGGVIAGLVLKWLKRF